MSDFIFQFDNAKTAKNVYNELNQADKSDSEIFGENRDQILWLQVEPFRLHLMALQMPGYQEIVCIDQNVQFSNAFITYLNRHFLLLKVIQVYGRKRPDDFLQDEFDEVIETNPLTEESELIILSTSADKVNPLQDLIDYPNGIDDAL